MKEFTLIKPEHLLKGECFYDEKYPKGKATAHWAVKNQHTLKNCQVTNIMLFFHDIMKLWKEVIHDQM